MDSLSLSEIQLQYRFFQSIGVNMPNIIVQIPKNSFLGDARRVLIKSINDTAARYEQIPDDPRKRGLCWVLINEVETGNLTCGGADVTSMMLPCVAMVYLPEGVLNAQSRADYVKGMHEAFKISLPANENRQAMTSIVLYEIADGTWGANGTIWTLPQFAKAAGFAHLQHLVIT
jgi:phenylpyruvate tautomerase PptA (4-oxalocrotonate tautomerase family)